MLAFSRRQQLLLILLASLALNGAAVHAATPAELLQAYAQQARKEAATFKDFSAGAGEKFYLAAVKHSSGRQISCATCHSDNAKNVGKHEKTSKEIAPLAPAANKARFSDSANVEKWFRRNCQDVLERACTTQEKGNFIAYLLTLK